MKYVLACLLCSVMFSTAFADAHKTVVVKERQIILKSGFTKEQHMAAEAYCKGVRSSMNGKELKDCIKRKLNTAL